MRYLRIFLLNFEIVITERAKALVWLLIALIPPVILYLYWRGALASNNGVISGWTLPTISTYYFLLLFVYAISMSHIEKSVARDDIQHGGLTKFLVKPFSYYLLKFFEETPWRILESIYAVLILLVLTFFFKNLLVVTTDASILALSVIIIILAYILSFTFKMVLGLCAFWLTDIFGFHQLMDAVILFSAGLLLPLSLLPSSLSQIAYTMPFAYMIYFPILALQGTQSIQQLLQIILMQVVWIVIMGFIYSRLWKNGIKKFTGVGQ